MLALIGLQGCGGGSSGNGGQDPPGAGEPPPPPPPPSNPDSGLDSRPANATCRAWPRPSAGSDISLSRFTNLTFTLPLGLLQAPNDNARWFVVQQDGIVRQFTGTNPASASNFIDLSLVTSRVLDGGEMGLLGMAFHPDYPTDDRVFLSFTTGDPMVSRVSSFRSTDGGATLNPTTETQILTIDQPDDNHNGGNIGFGPDGYLYIGIGDGGGGGDPRNNGQRLTTMLGKMLRIDVDGAAPAAYRIPPTNPFAGAAVCPPAGRTGDECPEIYAYGLRNPWRWSFDGDNGDLWVADVGQGLFEEVNVVTSGGNYGWRCREGAHDFNSGNTPECSSATLIDPVTEYDHTLGGSITGGFVYRGTQTTALYGRFIFGDFESGRIWAWIPENATQPRQPTELLDSDLLISSFGQGNDGELYVVNYYGGTLHRIVFESTGVIDTAPRLLSDTGCVSTSDPKQPATGLIPYAINAPFWSDGADKDRWMALPDGQNITVQTSGDWDFPAGTVLMKNFRFGTQLIETRLFMRHPDGAWGGFTYEWNAQQTQATLLQGGAVRDLGDGRSWIFPNEGQCLECHTEAAGRALGPETAQLNRSMTYPLTGRMANELTTLNHIGMLTPAITDAAAQPTLPDPAGTAPIGERARAYLHTNCSQCHRPGGTTQSNMDLRYSTSLLGTNACDALPASDLGLGANARLIAPGSSTNSLLVYRMNRRDSSAMPPLGSNTVDTAGVSLIAQWIDGLTACQ